MNQTPMDGFLIGTFLDDADRCHASFLMDGPDSSRISRLVMSRFLQLQGLRFLDAEYADDHSISTTCLHQWMVYIAPVFRDLECLDFLVLENLDFPSVGLPIASPLVGISSPAHEDLTPSQLLQIRRLIGICSRSDGSDPFSLRTPPVRLPRRENRRSRYSSSADPTTVVLSPELAHFLPELGRISIFQRPRPLSSSSVRSFYLEPRQRM
jgi:hypothetical protein